MKFSDIITGLNINKKLGDFVLDIPELHVPQGFSTALIGENGAGKTTLLNILSGIRLDASGTFSYFGKEQSVDAPGVKDNIGYTGGNLYFLPQWTVPQVKKINSLLFDSFDPARFDALCEELALDADAKKPGGKKVSELSEGNKIKLMLAGIFARETELLLLDEPASPLDPLMRDKLCDLLRAYLAAGEGKRSVFFSTHNISDMESVTDYAIILEHGKIVEEGFVPDLKEKYVVVRGDAKDEATAKSVLFSITGGSFGFEGICLAEDLDKLAGLSVDVETPSLYQISVAVMKQSSRVRF